MSNSNNHDNSVETVDEATLAQELGYAECDWDALSQAERDLHDQIVEMSVEELNKIDFTKATDLIRWAAAQTYADAEVEENYFVLAQTIAESRAKHPAIDYSDITAYLFEDYLQLEMFDRAESLIPHLEHHFAGIPFIRDRYEAVLKIVRGDREAGLADFQKILDKADDDIDTLFDLAQDLLGCTEIEAAEDIIARIEELGDGDEEIQAAVDEIRALVDEILWEEEEEGAEPKN